MSFISPHFITHFHTVLPTPHQARPDRVTQQLLAEGVELEGHGGTVQLVHTSAYSGLGLEDLKEALLLQV